MAPTPLLLKKKGKKGKRKNTPKWVPSSDWIFSKRKETLQDSKDIYYLPKVTEGMGMGRFIIERKFEVGNRRENAHM